MAALSAAGGSARVPLRSSLASSRRALVSAATCMGPPELRFCHKDGTRGLPVVGPPGLPVVGPPGVASRLLSHAAIGCPHELPGGVGDRGQGDCSAVAGWSFAAVGDGFVWGGP